MYLSTEAGLGWTAARGASSLGASQGSNSVRRTFQRKDGAPGVAIPGVLPKASAAYRLQPPVLSIPGIKAVLGNLVR